MTPALGVFILQMAIKYGPDVFAAARAMFSEHVTTIDMLESLYNKLKPYESFGIPDAAPVK